MSLSSSSGSVFDLIANTSASLLKTCLETKTLVDEPDQDVFEKIKEASQHGEWLERQIEEYNGALHRAKSRASSAAEDPKNDPSPLSLGTVAERRRFEELRDHVHQLKDDLVDLSFDKHQVSTILERIRLNSAMLEAVFVDGGDGEGDDIQIKRQRVQKLFRKRDEISCTLLKQTADDEAHRVRLFSVMQDNAGLLVIVLI